MGLPRAARRLRSGPSGAPGGRPGESRGLFWTRPEVRLELLGEIFGHPESIRSSIFRSAPFEMLFG